MIINRICYNNTYINYMWRYRFIQCDIRIYRTDYGYSPLPHLRHTPRTFHRRCIYAWLWYFKLSDCPGYHGYSGNSVSIDTRDANMDLSSSLARSPPPPTQTSCTFVHRRHVTRMELVPFAAFYAESETTIIFLLSSNSALPMREYVLLVSIPPPPLARFLHSLSLSRLLHSFYPSMHWTCQHAVVISVGHFSFLRHNRLSERASFAFITVAVRKRQPPCEIQTECLKNRLRQQHHHRLTPEIAHPFAVSVVNTETSQPPQPAALFTVNLASFPSLSLCLPTAQLWGCCVRVMTTTRGDKRIDGRK